jgi:hypothetical protein
MTSSFAKAHEDRALTAAILILICLAATFASTIPYAEAQTIHHIYLYVCVDDVNLCGMVLPPGDIIGADIYWDGKHTVTGFGGHATLDVYAGTYTIRAEKAGYEAEEVTVTVVDQSLWVTIRLPKLQTQTATSTTTTADDSVEPLTTHPVDTSTTHGVKTSAASVETANDLATLAPYLAAAALVVVCAFFIIRRIVTQNA